MWHRKDDWETPSQWGNGIQQVLLIHKFGTYGFDSTRRRPAAGGSLGPPGCDQNCWMHKGGLLRLRKAVHLLPAPQKMPSLCLGGSVRVNCEFYYPQKLKSTKGLGMGPPTFLEITRVLLSVIFGHSILIVLLEVRKANLTILEWNPFRAHSAILQPPSAWKNLVLSTASCKSALSNTISTHN